MSRLPSNTVTPLPILINADPEEADGEVVHFPSPRARGFAKVRVISAHEIETKVQSRKVFAANDAEKPLYDALKDMPVAFEQLDMPVFQESLSKARPWVPLPFGPGLRVKDWGGARWVYSSLMSNVLRSVRLAVWFPYAENRWAAPIGESVDQWAAPAIYCADEKTAAYAMLFMDYLRVCQNVKCRKLYVPHVSTQKYCDPRHGGSNRTKRSRNKKKNARKSLR
jgi:hypothetical protein